MAKGILTNREREVFELLILNKTTKDIAKELSISEKTVRNRLKEHGGYWIDEGNVGKK